MYISIHIGEYFTKSTRKYLILFYLLLLRNTIKVLWSYKLRRLFWYISWHVPHFYQRSTAAEFKTSVMQNLFWWCHPFDQFLFVFLCQLELKPSSTCTGTEPPEDLAGSGTCCCLSWHVVPVQLFRFNRRFVLTDRLLFLSSSRGFPFLTSAKSGGFLLAEEITDISHTTNKDNTTIRKCKHTHTLSLSLQSPSSLLPPHPRPYLASLQKPVLTSCSWSELP